MPTVNRTAPNENHTQSVLFAKQAGWTKASSRKWLQGHNRDGDNKYFLDGYDETENQHRWRQYDPQENRFRYRNQVIEEKNGKPSITLVLGFPKGSRRPQTRDNKTMSMTKTIKTLEESNAALTAKVEELQVAVDSMNAVNEDLTKQLSDANATLESERTAAVESAEQMAKLADGKIDEATARADKAESELAKAVEKLDAANLSLSSPAYQDARGQGSDAVDTGDPAPDTPGTDLLAEYHAIDDSKEKTAFWNKHQEEIQEQQNNK